MINDDYVTIEHFGKDHWSVFAYAETVMVDNQGFQIGFDGRMRQGRANFQVMAEQCPKPKRQRHAGVHSAIVMDNKWSTCLKDQTVVEGHDDWHCVQDLVHAGLMGIKKRDLIVPLDDEVEPGKILFLTTLGEQVASQLRCHKIQGGSFSNFEPRLD